MSMDELAELVEFSEAFGADLPDDRLHLDLQGARERLCRAQGAVSPHWASDLQAAIDHIDLVGSAVCPEQWSEHAQPEYPEEQW